MNLFDQLKDEVLAAVAGCQAAGSLPAELPLERILVEPPREAAHGDAATNAALLLAKPAGQPPMAVAELLAEALRGLPFVQAVAVAKPGFINLSLTDQFWRAQLQRVLQAGSSYGRADLGRGQRINVEYCSANPTGRLHIGHCRGTVFGDALANLLAHMGWDVVREFYVNDGGAQVDRLARSVHYRYLEALSAAPPLPPGDWYPSEDLIVLGRAIAAEDRDRWQHAAEADWLPVFRSRGIDTMLALIREDLAALGVQHDIFVSEVGLVERGMLERALAILEARGLLYEGVLPAPKGKPDEDWEPVPLLLFRSTAFGDDVDRPLKSSGGAWTYFAKDLACHLNKFERGAHAMIDVLGADHGGYVKRMRAAVTALSDGQASLDVKLCQLVNMLDAGQPLRMSRRAGRIVTLRDVIDEVGKDVVRFIMLTRRNDAPLDFDLVKVTEQSRDNPVFYVQYAHARIRSVQRHAAEAGLALADADLLGTDLSPLADEFELAVIKQLAQFPRILAAAAQQHEPHRIAFYLGDLAAAFHALWNQGKERPELRFLRADEPASTAARLALLEALRIVLATGLELIGVAPVEELI